MNKRIMSFLLSLVMIFSMMVSAVPAYAAGPTQLKVTADKAEANPGDTITFTITLGPVSDMGTMQMDLVIPEGLTYVANSVELASGLKETLGFDTADWTEVTRRINGVASAANYSSSSDTVIATFECTVNDDFSGTAKVGLDNLEFYSVETWEDHTDDYSVVTADITVAAAHEHEYGTKIEAQPEVHTPTELKAGVKAYFYCDDCDTYFTEGKVETTLAALTGKTPEHSYGEWVNTDPENHWKACSCGLKANEGSHTYDDAKDTSCNDCGYVRTIAHEHEFEEKWSWNETNHWHASTCGHDVKSGEEAHHGGTATCTTQAVCVDCGQSYGAFAEHNYGTKVEAKPEVHETDKLEAGVAAHFYCDVCEKYFTEEKVETTLEDLTGKTPEHSYGEWVNTDPENHWEECSCGLKANEGKHAYDNILDAECNDCGHEREVVVPEVKLNMETLSLEVEETETLAATVTPEGLEGYTLEWASDATDVATVDENGKVTAVAKGEANITVTLVLGTLAKTTISDTCAVTVKEPEPEVPATTSVTVSKVWDVPETFDRADLPESVSVVLMANGESYGEPVTLNEENDWTCTWTELPVAKEDGKAIEYAVDEVEVPEGYEKTITDAEVPAGVGYVITNTLKETEPEVPATTAVTVVKEWNAPEGTVLPESVEVYLLANGQEVTDSRTVLDEGNKWTYTWTELPVAEEDGTTIVYTVDEVEVEGYEKAIGEAIETDTGIEIAITNTLKEDPEKPVYGIVVNNGKSYAGAGVEVSAAEEGTKITLKANAASEGKEFDKWVVNNGTITLADATKAETAFDMPAERVQVTATYKDKVVTPPADDDNDDNKDDVNKPSDDDKEDESKPSDTNKPATDTESPKTGDTSNIFMWFAVLFVSGFALVGFLLFGKRRRA